MHHASSIMWDQSLACTDLQGDDLVSSSNVQSIAFEAGQNFATGEEEWIKQKEPIDLEFVPGKPSWNPCRHNGSDREDTSG